MARRDHRATERPGNNAADAGVEATRRKIDQIVQSVTDVGHQPNFDAIAAREIRRLQRAATRRSQLTAR